jgi:two-component system, LuxR family, response regulator FixJ
MEADPTVFVVDDDATIRRMVAVLLQSVGFTRVAAYPSAEAFLEAGDPDRPGCLLLDVRLPGMSGPQLQRTLAARGVPLPIIMLSGHADVPTAVGAVQGGAVHFLEKPVREQVLLECIRSALAHDRRNRSARAQRAAVQERLARLTGREREVLGLVLQGQANKQIAAELGVTVKAIESHRSRMLKKLQVHSMTELLRQAYGAGLCVADAAAPSGAPWASHPAG